MSDGNANSLELPSDLGKSPQAIARRWKLEIKLADKRETAWRKKVKDIYEIYTPTNAARNSFNILWSNTETLRQSVYNSLPQPDARRRYQDEDPIGMKVGEVLTRSLEFSQDSYDFDKVLKDDVLSMLLAGRSVSRIRYIPDIISVDGDHNEETDESDTYEEIGWEQVICERVQYDDFRILCAAKTWDEVSAVAFRHRLNREDLIDKFGAEIGKAISLDSADDADIAKSSDIEDLFKTAEIWEIWDKDAKEVIFICQSYPSPCKIQPDPLKMQGFFPIPRPLYAIENDQTLVPAPLYSQYEQQAKELNLVTKRINLLVDALKLRGVYDATLTELENLMKGTDNDLIPSQNVTALMERGGLEKAIFFMPIEMAANVVKVLYEQRDAVKQVIYEITGISDIMRSASDPNETFGAQKIKTQWGTQRLQRMQRETQRYIRDLIRMKAEIISSKFQMETLEKMTLVDLPHQAQVDAANQQAMAQWHQQSQQIQQQFHMQAMQAPQGQPAPQPPQMPPPPQPQNPVTWEQVMGAMRDDATRTYRIDIETDSTLTATQDSDMQGLQQVLSAVNQVLQGFAPAVQQGIIPIEAVKEIMLSVVRRARMGTAVEDALEKMQPPPPPPPPPPDPATIKAQTDQANMQQKSQIEQAKMQQEMQIEQMRQQAVQQQQQQEFQLDQQRAHLQSQVDMINQQAQQNQEQAQQQMAAHNESVKQRNEMILERMRMEADERNNQMQQQLALIIAKLNNEAKIEVAEIAAQTQLQAAQISAAKSGSE